MLVINITLRSILQVMDEPAQRLQLEAIEPYLSSRLFTGGGRIYMDAASCAAASAAALAWAAFIAVLASQRRVYKMN